MDDQGENAKRSSLADDLVTANDLTVIVGLAALIERRLRMGITMSDEALIAQAQAIAAAARRIGRRLNR